MNHELRDQLSDAAITAGKAMHHVSQQQNLEESENNNLPANQTIDDVLAEKSKEKDDQKVSMEIAVMQPILRFLQLLCENHNRDLQVSYRSNLSLCGEE